MTWLGDDIEVRSLEEAQDLRAHLENQATCGYLRPPASCQGGLAHGLKLTNYNVGPLNDS